MKQLLCKVKNIRSSQLKGETILLSTLSVLKEAKVSPQGLLSTAIKNLHPGLKIITKIRSGKAIPLPAYQTEDSANYYAIRWLYKAAQARKYKGFTIKDLVHEIRDALAFKGLAFKSKIELVKEIRAARVNLRKSFRKFKKFKFKKVFKKDKPGKRMLLTTIPLSCIIDRRKKKFPRAAKNLYNKRKYLKIDMKNNNNNKKTTQNSNTIATIATIAEEKQKSTKLKGFFTWLDEKKSTINEPVEKSKNKIFQNFIQKNKIIYNNNAQIAKKH